jgi:acetylxylan esterase
MSRNRASVCAVLLAALGFLATPPAQAGSWQSNYAFGASLKGDLYTPTKLGTPPAILVAIHYCGGNSGATHSWFQSAADTNGFYIIAPDAGKNCFDSSASRDGDKAAIVTMVDAVVKLGGDKNRVFAAGYSSGGCMTNTLLAVYPDVFAGGSALPGYPAGAWPKNDTSCSLCGGSGPGASDTGQKYADLVKGVFSFSGTRPCSQQWVGGGDQYHFAQWLPVTASEFQILGNLGSGTSGTGVPSGWTRTVYKDTSGNVRLEINLGPSSQQHDLTGNGLNGDVITFLGLDKPTGACGLATASSGDGGTGATGGATGIGGSSGMGGITGAKDGGVGGSKDGGYDSVVGSGGVAGSGGATGSGGSASSGGAAGNGGAIGSGGSSSSGGGSGEGSGGKLTSGGTSGNGGTSSTGGTSSSGGSYTMGGNSGYGGSGSGGMSSGERSGGSSTTAGGATSSGCSCAVGGTTGPGKVLALFLLAALGLVLRRRRQTLG